MGAHPWGEPVVDWAQVQIDGLQAAEGALDPGETLIGADDAFGGQGVVCEAGADDIETRRAGPRRRCERGCGQS